MSSTVSSTIQCSEQYSSEDCAAYITCVDTSQQQRQSGNLDNQTQAEASLIRAVSNLRIARNKKDTVQQPNVDSSTSSRRDEDTGERSKDKIAHRLSSLENGTDLYDIIRNNRVSLTTIVDRWIEKYNSNRENAILILMQFFISSSGCKGCITSEMQLTMEHVAIIRKMTEEFDEESSEYPLIMAGRQWKKFRSNFGDFVQILVRQCQNSIIYDQFLIDNIVSLLTVLSDSQVRAFRHTSTFAAMKLMTALVKVALTVFTNLNNTQRQYTAEIQKTQECRAIGRLESLMAKQEELKENMNEIKNMFTYLFKSVFVHRYKDIVPDIRAICMTEIGVWIKKFHQNFLDDSYLKYIGWTLYDKVGKVRLKCLQVLQPLYALEELKTKLELFTRKFKDRIVAMMLDKEHDVAVQAIMLAISMLKYHREIFTDADRDQAYELVYSSNRAVARAAGKYVNEYLFRPDDKAVAEVRTGRGKKRNTPFIRDLVLFFIESELHEHGAYLVDSLIETHEMMKDWECMTDLLLEEPGPEEEALDNLKEIFLIELMVCCVRQAATGEAPVGRRPTRKTTSAKEKEKINDDKRRLTKHFIKTLPLLLHRYRADPEKLVNLLAIPQYFDLDVYSRSRREMDLDSLLSKISMIVEKTHSTEVVDTAAKTLEYMCVEDHIIFTNCDVSRSMLIDSIVNNYRKAIDEYQNFIERNEVPDEDKTFSITQSLMKISIFYSYHNMNRWNIWDSLYKTIADTKNLSRTATYPTASGYLPLDAIKYCISACSLGILWRQNDLMEAADSDNFGEDEYRQLKEWLHSFMDLIRYFVSDDSDNMLILKEEAYNTICDLLVIFCNKLNTHTNHLMHQLVYEADEAMRTMLNRFVQKYVFVEQENDPYCAHSRIQELYTRRNFLAGYCKLIVHKMIPMEAAADIVKHYVKYYNAYGDVIKTMLGIMRDINKTKCALTIQQSLSILYNEIVPEKGVVNQNSEKFTAIRDLARRFALSFGFNAVKSREAIITLHRSGILFVLTPSGSIEQHPTRPPPNLPFLGILSEFTSKLLKQDKRFVLNFLDKRLPPGVPSSRDEDLWWQPLFLYRNSLLDGNTDQISMTTKRAHRRRKRNQLVDEEANKPNEELSRKRKKKRDSQKLKVKTAIKHKKNSSRKSNKENNSCENNNSARIQTSPLATIESTPTRQSQDFDDKFKTPVRQSQDFDDKFKTP